MCICCRPSPKLQAHSPEPLAPSTLLQDGANPSLQPQPLAPRGSYSLERYNIPEALV